MKPDQPGGSLPLPFWGGLRSGLVDLMINADAVPEPTRRLVAAVRRSLVDRSLHPLTGPLRDADGALRIPAGEQAGPEDIRAMDWLCEGVEEVSDNGS